MAETGLIGARLRTPQGEWRTLDEDGVRAWTAGDGLLWVHLDRQEEWAGEYLRDASGLDPIVTEALLAEETRPRATPLGVGHLVILRGVNLNPGADPVDMVSLRIWVERDRVVTTRLRPLRAVQALLAEIDRGAGPATTGELITRIANGLTERMADVIEGLDDRESEIEAQMLESNEASSHRRALAEIRREAITLRRYLAPQREAVGRLIGEEAAWIAARDRLLLREVTDRTVRYLEDLDSVRERAAVVQDELANRLAEQMNRNTYLLSIVAAIMLPLGLVTGLLGINVDGMPGAENAPWAFAAVCIAMGLVAAWEVWLLKRLKWL